MSGTLQLQSEITQVRRLVGSARDVVVTNARRPVPVAVFAAVVSAATVVFVLIRRSRR